MKRIFSIEEKLCAIGLVFQGESLTFLCHTCGLGSKIGSMNLDLSYQYSATDGDFYPFQPNITGSVPSASVSNKRHQVLLTLGYTF